MLSLVQVLALSFVMLFSTTIDDLVVLFTICFNIVNSKDSDEVKKQNLRYTYIGYLLGFSFVVACSLVGLLVNHFAKINERYIALLGFVPICLGSYCLYCTIREKCTKKEPLLKISDDKYVTMEDNNGESRISQVNSTRSIVEIEEEEDEMNFVSKWFLSVLTYFGINHTIAHAFCLTFSVGSDNIIIYIAFFLQIDYSEIVIVIAIFLFVSVIYGFAAITLAKRYEETLKKYSDYLEPVAALAIIGIGAYILSESIIFNA
jgi:cadmium resistance protein CadD (predicted permease)